MLFPVQGKHVAPGVLAVPGGCLGCDSHEELVQRELSQENKSGPGKDLGIVRSVLKLIGNLTSSHQGG